MKKMTLVLSLLILGSFSLQLSAQESIKVLIKKCEKTESAEVTYVIQKDPKTGKQLNYLTTVKIKNDDNLVNELLQALEKDKDNAYMAQGSIKNGVPIPSNYEFFDGKHLYTSCHISLSQATSGATITYRESSKKPVRVYSGIDGHLILHSAKIQYDSDSLPSIIRFGRATLKMND